MTTNYIKRMGNEIENIIKNSTRYILSEFYYIVCIKLDINEFGIDHISKCAEKLLHSDPNPLAVYYNMDMILIIFPNIDSNQLHQYDGDQSLIISKYILFVLEYDVNVQYSQILEFSIRDNVISVLIWYSFQCYQNEIKKMSNGKIDDAALCFKTDDELLEILQESNCDFKKVDPRVKYGSLIKLDEEDNIVNITERIVAPEQCKYITFVFG